MPPVGRAKCLEPRQKHAHVTLLFTKFNISYYFDEMPRYLNISLFNISRNFSKEDSRHFLFKSGYYDD